MNSKIKQIIIAIFLFCSGLIIGNVTVEYFDKEDGVCLSDEFTDNDYYIACSEGCNKMGIVYESEYNISQDFDTFNICSKACLDSFTNKSS